MWRNVNIGLNVEMCKNFVVIFYIIKCMSLFLCGFRVSVLFRNSKESTCNWGYLGSVPGLGRSSGERKGYPLWFSGLENSMDCIAHRVTMSQT